MGDGLTIGGRLTKLMEARQWKDADVKTRAGMHQQTVGKLRRDRTDEHVSFASVYKLAQAFGVSVEYMGTGIDDTSLPKELAEYTRVVRLARECGITPERLEAAVKLLSQ